MVCPKNVPFFENSFSFLFLVIIDSAEYIVSFSSSKSILDKITNDDYVILLDLRGKYYSSIEVSQLIDQASIYGSKNIVFIIGGSLGVD